MTIHTVPATVASLAVNKARDPISPAGHNLRPELAAFYALGAQDRFPPRQITVKGVLAELALNRGRD